MSIRFTKRIFAAVAACALLLLPARSLADTVTVVNTAFSFSNPQTFGPWSINTVDYQWKAANDTPSVTLFFRTDHDGGNVSKTQAVYADDYHTWSKTFYTYAQVGFAAGTIEPNRQFYAEGVSKFGKAKNLEFAVGGAVMYNPGGTITRYGSIGPSWYVGRMAYTIRFEPSNTGGVNTAGTAYTASYDVAGKEQTSVSITRGTQPSVLAGVPAYYATFQHLTTESVSWTHWLNHKVGVVLGFQAIANNDSTNPQNRYNAKAFSTGIVLGRDVNLSKTGP